MLGRKKESLIVRRTLADHPLFSERSQRYGNCEVYSSVLRAVWTIKSECLLDTRELISANSYMFRATSVRLYE